MSGLVKKIATCNVKEKNNPDILVSIFTESKLKEKICSWIVNKFDGVQVFISGLEFGHLSAGVVVIMNSSLAKHVCKVLEVSDWLLSIKLLFKNKLLVLILGLYANVSLAVWFSQTGNVNFLIAKTVNESFFVIFGGDFNKNSSYKCASFKKCLDLGLVNSLVSSPTMKEHTWTNSNDVIKMIDYMFVSLNLINAIIHYDVLKVSKHFDMDYQSVSVSVSLGGLLDTCLNFFHKQDDFKDATSANVAMFSVLLANRMFKKKWFKSFDDVFTKNSSRFHRLKLLVSRIVKTSCEESVASAIQDIVDSGAGSNHIHSALFGTRKFYHTAKLAKFLSAKKVNIRSAIDKRIESFEVNKSHMIRSILERPFHKVVLDHLIVNDELILEPDLVKSKVDIIMEGWIKKHRVVDDIFVFFGVMCSINFNKLFEVVSNLPDNKAASLSDISNELWKYCNKTVLVMFLVFLNSCLFVSIIPKPYEWKSVLTNICPIALIKMACKIFSKILFDRISLACSTFDVLCGDIFSVLKDIMT
ncbi:hypothetical protein G9A89_015333 [Geosiphon pyriformis]|nr:hypothetical protein G9A89_015333 [Geosiphon pyriformis]